jgi:hypothetical protein
MHHTQVQDVKHRETKKTNPTDCLVGGGLNNYGGMVAEFYNNDFVLRFQSIKFEFERLSFGILYIEDLCELLLVNV